MNIFQKASQQMNLTPTERAALKLVEGLGYVVVINALYVITDYLSTNGNIDYALLTKLILWQVVLALLLSLSKYFKAHGDPTLGAAIDVAETQLVARAPQALQQPVQAMPMPSSNINQAVPLPLLVQPPRQPFTLPDNYLSYPTQTNIPVTKPAQ